MVKVMSTYFNPSYIKLKPQIKSKFKLKLNF